MTHPNENFMRKYSNAWKVGDIDTVREMYAEDLVVHISGRSPLAGVYRGKEAFFGYINKIMELTGGKVEIVEIKDILANEGRAVVLVRERLQRIGKKTLEANRVVVYQFCTGKISEVWGYEDDQYAVDEFFS